ncbi:MAG: DUF3108 domain-containing protein [Candidatus Marinimicrobia bacterium]|nr:DUF3108 domain-containing protein [Candidatus Neomarinimicrobiota bacterium]
MKFLTKSIILFVLLFISTAWGEKLVYSAGFRLFDAGEAIFTTEIKPLNDAPTLLITSTIKTNSFLSRFYKVRDVVKVWSNINDLTLIKIEKEVNEGNYHLDYSAHVSEDLKLISNTKTIQLASKVYDPISAIFMLRKQSLIEGDSYKFTTVENGIIQKVNVMVGKIEKVSVPAGKFNTRQIIPISDDGKPLFKHDGKMKVWYSDDDRHLPVKMEQKTNVGTLILQLKKYTP